MSILKLQQERLLIELQQHRPRSTKPLELRDPFILTSCLQKALRRGDAQVAMPAARALLGLDSARLWRRLVIVAFEDFGLSDLDLTSSVVAAAADRRWRARVGGDDHVMPYLIECMVARSRDRRVDNLYMLAVRHVRHPASRQDFLAQRPSGTATNLVLLAERIVAGCEQEVPRRALRTVIAAQCDRALQEMADGGLLDEGLHTTCAQARRTSMCLLPVVFPIIKAATEEVGGAPMVLPRETPEVRLIGEVPSYALDGFTRVGQWALARLARSDRAVGGVVDGLRGNRRSDALTYLLFEAEGGICTTELSDPLYDELKRLALGCWTGLPRAAVPDAIEIMRDAVPRLNDIRQDLWAMSEHGNV